MTITKLAHIVFSAWLMTGTFLADSMFDITLFTGDCQRVYSFDAQYVYVDNGVMEYYTKENSGIWILDNIKEIQLKQKDGKLTILKKIDGQFRRAKYPSCNLQI